MVEPSRSRRYFLPKKERLRKKRAFEYLFEHGDSLRVGVLTFFYALNVPADYVEAPVSVAFAAPKRKFKRAVDRNFLKRRMREAYRLHKQLLGAESFPPGSNLILLMAFRAQQRVPYQQIEKAAIRGLQLVRERLDLASGTAEAG